MSANWIEPPLTERILPSCHSRWSTGRLKWLGSSFLNRHQPQVLLFYRGDFNSLSGTERLGAIHTYITSPGVQQHLRATGVDAENAGREADAKLQYLYPDGAGSREVAQFMDHHQDQQQRGKSADCKQERFH